MTTLNAEIDVSAFSAICWKVGTPLAFKALCALKRSDWLFLVSIEIKPASYTCPLTYLGDAQIAAFFRKRPGLNTGLDPEKAAIDNFWKSERQCYHSNERLSPLFDDLGHFGDGVKRVFLAWRKELRRTLRRAPSRVSLLKDAKFGPGATFLNTGDCITVADKLSDGYAITPGALSFSQIWDQTAWSRYAACDLIGVDGSNTIISSSGQELRPGCGSFAPRDVSIVRGNRFATVPKDSRKHRGIAIEPSLNVFFQLAVGSVMSHRMLETWGWDKRSCQDFHKVLARLGSLTGAVATIDLSNASDTVSFNLVKLLLPRDWFLLVTELRSSHTLIQGRWVKLEKFSSMGNGFTFELETLLFLSLARVLVELEGHTEDAFTPGLAVSCFGDDIILPSSVSRSAVAVLNFAGFTVNKTKSFFDGPFRESCGGDFFSGHDVRPHYQDKEIEAPHQLIALANGIRRFDRRFGALSGSYHNRNAWFLCLDGLPRGIRQCRGPEELGDLVIHDDEDRWIRSNPIRVRNSIRYLRTWRPVPNRLVGWEHYRPGVTLAAALYGCASGAPTRPDILNPVEFYRRTGIVPRLQGSYVSGYRFGRVAYS